jgi:hypothetical protein
MKIHFEWHCISGITTDKLYILVYKGDKPRNDIEAKRISVAKWEIICDMLKNPPGRLFTPDDIIDGCTSTCGFCMLHIEDDCVGCPIFAMTGYNGCSGTPYEDWEEVCTLETAESILELVKGVKVEEGLHG